MKTVIVDTVENQVKILEVEDKLDTWYAMLHCEWIDIVAMKIGGKYFDVICDDEGLLKENPIMSARSRELDESMLYGSIAIVNLPDVDGNLVGLDEEDVDLILHNVGLYRGALENVLRPFLVCEN